MNIHASDVILLAHATAGVLGTLAALWVFVEALNARDENAQRTRLLSVVVAVCMTATLLLGGYWYLRFYPADRALILTGPWPFAHTVFMETKEHLFFVTLILSLYLPLAARDLSKGNASARNLVLSLAALIVLTGLALEGSGAVINHGAKLALQRTSVLASR